MANTTKELLKKLKESALITGACILGFILISYFFVGFKSASDEGMLQYFAQMMGGE